MLRKEQILRLYKKKVWEMVSESNDLFHAGYLTAIEDILQMSNQEKKDIWDEASQKYRKYIEDKYKKDVDFRRSVDSIARFMRR